MQCLWIRSNPSYNIQKICNLYFHLINRNFSVLQVHVSCVTFEKSENNVTVKCISLSTINNYIAFAMRTQRGFRPHTITINA